MENIIESVSFVQMPLLRVTEDFFDFKGHELMRFRFWEKKQFRQRLAMQSNVIL